MCSPSPAATIAGRSSRPLGNTYQNGTIVGDHDKYNRTTARLKATQFFGSKLRVGGNISYMDVRARYVQKGNNLNGILLGLARTPPDFDNFPYVVDGLHRSYRYPNPDPRTRRRPRVRQPVLGHQPGRKHVGREPRDRELRHQLGRAAVAQPQVHVRRRLLVRPAHLEGLPPQSAGDALTGQLWQGTYTNLQLDGNFVATAEKKWSDAFNTTLTLGQNLNSRDLRQVQAKGTTYIDPDLFTLNNTVNSNLQAQNYSSLVRVAGYFAQAGSICGTSCT